MRDWKRREFIGATLAAAGLGGLGAGSSGAAAPAFGRAMIVKKLTEATLRPLKEAGFDGLEAGLATEAEAVEGRKLAEGLGLRVHSVLRGWAEFNSEDPAKVEESLKVTRDAMRGARAYGADAVLLVPCKIGGMPMPEPWEYEIEFDERTGHITRLTREPKEEHRAYVAAHNRATDTSREAVAKLIPLAAELKVTIALENVWNNLWVQPKIFRHFVASFGSEWVRAYFDVGNHVKYGKPQDWIRELGSLIAKVHIKDFQLEADGRGGKFVHPRDGSVEWPVVKRALDEIGYRGWMTIEDRDLSLTEFRERLDLIIAGK